VSQPAEYENMTRGQLLEKIQELKASLIEHTAFSGSDQYRELFEQSADPILIIDGDTFVDCNQSTVDMLRYRTKEELLQTHPSELSPEKQPDGRISFDKANEMMAIAFEKGSHRFEWNHLRADGSEFPVEVLLTPVNKGDRMILHVVWRDITERKRLELELRHAQKMEAIGHLTGGIAHDFNNLLVAILGYSDLLEMELPQESELRDFVQQIKISGERAAALVGQLLAFSRKQVMQPKVIELNKVIADLEKMLLPLLGEDINFGSQLHKGPLYIKADPGQLEQVVVNLATNARDAMPQGGSLVVETRLVQLDDHGGHEGLKLNPGPYALVLVSDSGQGIDPAHLDKIFDPFFTTKAVDKGTGLGLSTVHGIIKQSHGDIVVRSELGSGTVFKVYLPLTFERPKSSDTQQVDLDGPGLAREKTILVVEDEAAVSGLVEAVLRREGYRIVVAANGVEALALVERMNLKPDLLLTDVIMPKMGGPELAGRLNEKLPNMKVLYSSGYTNNALIDRGALAEGVELIQKPFAPRDLVKRLQSVLNGN
jgi:PAS domain S-box-containing protein